tara:strand:- start:996 stop:1358 length:363 start_codon:yes stop_codon:yes gene_type:complete
MQTLILAQEAKDKLSWLENLLLRLTQEALIQLPTETLILLLEAQQGLKCIEIVHQQETLLQILLQAETAAQLQQEAHLQELHLTEVATLEAHQPEVHQEEVVLQALHLEVHLQEEKDKIA